MNTREERKEVVAQVEMKTQMTVEEFQKKLQQDLETFLALNGHPTQKDTEKIAQDFVDKHFFHTIEVKVKIKGAHEPEVCSECEGSGFGRTEGGTLSDGSCAVCSDAYIEQHYGRKL